MSAPSGFDRIAERERGLRRSLSSGQMTMIAIGGAIGTGLFLGSSFAIGFAGPSVLLSYAIGGVITLLLMGCLAEVTVAHSTSGSFGAYAEHYIFRRRRERERAPPLSFRLIGFPVTTQAGFFLMLAILITTAFTEVFRMTRIFGLLFLGLLCVLYYWLCRQRAA